MKLEIEITEAEIKSAIERKIRVAVADVINSYRSDEAIKRYVNEQWSEVMQKTVRDVLGNSEVIKAKVEKALEAKIKAQLVALLKKGAAS